MRSAALLSLLVVMTLAADDSPLVEASKRAKQGTAKSKVVITNKTLVKKGGHITTTRSQPPLSTPAAAAAKTTTQPAAEKSAEPAAATPQTLPGLPEPVDDPLGYEPGAVDASDLIENTAGRVIPEKIRATPQFSKPGIVPDKVPPVAPATAKTKPATVAKGKPLHGVKPQTPQFTKTPDPPKQ